MSIRFTRARNVTVNANGGTYTLDYTIPDGKQLLIRELFASSNTSGVCIELLYSDDGGSTWTNPWDDNSSHLLKLWIAAYVPTLGSPQDTWFHGDQENIILRVKITNYNPTNNADVFFLVKAGEVDV